MIKKIIVISLLILSTSAFAKKNWDSYYAGVSAGVALGEAKSTDISGYNGVNGSEIKYNTNGAQLSAFGGKNWVLPNNFLIGAEAAIGYMNISNKKQFADYVGVRLPTDSQASTDNGAFVSFGARFGKVFNDNTLIYSKAGFIQTNIRQSFIDEDPTGCLLTSGTKASKNNGPFIGLGLEHSIYNNFNIRAEYTHYEFGTGNHVATGCIPAQQYSFDEKFKLDSLNFGAIYNF